MGVFDLFHRGHMELLKAARGFGDRLYVVVNGDDFTAAYKRRPLIVESDRLAIVSAVRWVDEAVIANSGDIKPFIERFNANVIVHGDDWPHDSYMRQVHLTESYVRDRGIKFVYTPYYQGVSTSTLISKIRADEA
ncbi:adenylyltransferase/cytidyltransferase family protein [Ramlibacter sp.]|uniref:adenylyltransferase/cytidyltransferase family protein n=1 Tax=Ramlibacter sp. TaxID=1917967 RepID=UPI0026060E96|nr:adenylyltransferase/cytidyltransferase family protein [Ramlibacter sp.]